MSNLQEVKNTVQNPLLLLKEIKNSGVEFKKLGEVCNFKRGSSLTSKQAINGNIPVISGGQKPAFYHNEANRFGETITVAGSGVYAGFVNYWDIPIFCADCFSVSPNDENILNKKYVYYFLKNNQDLIYHKKVGGAIPHVYSKMLTDFEIPLPPLEVQAEIVRILDSFTSFVNELIDLLKREQELRKKQYSYYRDKLLTFDGDTPNVKLGEVCNFKCGGDVPKGNFSKEKTDKYTIPIYSNGIGKNALYGYTDKAIITQKCVTISSRGTIGYSALREEAFYPIVRLICCFPNENLLPEFLVYAIQTIKFVIPKGGIPQLTIPMLKEYKIPLPPLDTQKRIVDILDNFERYTNDLQEGLPAEIEKRKKQYAYYRDELLRFERK